MPRSTRSPRNMAHKRPNFTTGEAFLSLLKGRTTYTLSRVSQASRYRRQTDEDLKESGETIKEAENQLQGLEAEFQQVLQAANEQWARVAAQAEEYRISALKKDIQTEMFGVGWIPTWYAEINGQQVFLPAFTG
jgi:glutamine synthetase adenylyltransferase